MSALRAAERVVHAGSVPTAGVRWVERTRVLVVDGDHDFADTLTRLLELLGRDARAAYGGPTALRLAAAFTPHAVLLDLSLTGQNADAIAASLRRMPGLGSVRLVAVTGCGTPECRRIAADAGFDAFLLKPFDAETLVSVLRCPAR
jgi:CheY-like chemotaxis protein